MKRNTIFKWLVPIVLVVCVLALFISRHFAGGAALFSRSLNDDAFALLGFVNANSSADNPSPVLGSIASFASDSTSLIQAVEAKDSARAADLVWHLETDRAVVNKALAVHPDALPAEEWAAAQRKLDAIVKRIPPVPAHPDEASKSTEEPSQSENVQAAPPTPSPKGVEVRVGQESFRDYSVRFFSEYFEISKNGKRIYRQQKSERDLGSLRIDAKFLKARIDVATLDALDTEDAPTGVVKMGMNVTGDGSRTSLSMNTPAEHIAARSCTYLKSAAASNELEPSTRANSTQESFLYFFILIGVPTIKSSSATIRFFSGATRITGM